jgi:hypothetical protein
MNFPLLIVIGPGRELALTSTSLNSPAASKRQSPGLEIGPCTLIVLRLSAPFTEGMSLKTPLVASTEESHG